MDTQDLPASDPASTAALDDALAVACGGRWTVAPLHASGFTGTWRADGRAGGNADRLFVKTLPAGRASPLQAEADGLAAIAATATVRVPEVVAQGADDGAGRAWLALAWLDLRPPDAGFGSRLGAALSALHAAPVDPPCYGWPRDNVLGATPQCNTPTAGATAADWAAFVAEARLGAMCAGLRAQAAASGTATDWLAPVDDVIAALPNWLAGPPAPRPSLIHGDLWSGNWGMLTDGTPVLFDPAVSWSDASAELAMMTLFGRPPPGFDDAYRAHGGRAAEPRCLAVHQLYHLLNHALLFGGGYRAQARSCALRLLGSR